MQSLRARFPDHRRAMDFVAAVGQQCSTNEVLEARRDSDVVVISVPAPIERGSQVSRLMNELGGQFEGAKGC